MKLDKIALVLFGVGVVGLIMSVVWTMGEFRLWKVFVSLIVFGWFTTCPVFYEKD